MSSNTPPDAPTELFFGYTSTAPDLAALNVKRVHPGTLLDCPAVFTVIGESHYVGIPALDFHELCSCASVSSETTYETPLSTAVEREFRFDGDRLDATTRVVGQPIDAFPGPDEATVVYRFGPKAWTTIHADDAGYETYHTYPERGLALYTETQLTRHDSRTESPTGDSVADDATADEAILHTTEETR